MSSNQLKTTVSMNIFELDTYYQLKKLPNFMHVLLYVIKYYNF